MFARPLLALLIIHFTTAEPQVCGDAIGYGWDYMTGSLFPSDQSFTGQMYPIFIQHVSGANIDSNVVWGDCTLHSHAVYQSVDIKGHAITANNIDAFYANFSLSVSVSVSMGFWNPKTQKGSMDFTAAAQYLHAESNSIVEQHGAVSYYKATCIPSDNKDAIAYTSGYLSAIEKIRSSPQNISTQQAMSLFKSYGLGVVVEEEAGARYGMRTHSTEELLEVYTAAAVDAEGGMCDSGLYYTVDEEDKEAVKSADAELFDAAIVNKDLWCLGTCPSTQDPNMWLNTVVTDNICSPISVVLWHHEELLRKNPPIGYSYEDIEYISSIIRRARVEYCVDVGACVAPPPPPPPPPATVTEEYLLSDRSTSTVVMTPRDSSFCFITHGQAWFQGGESCRIYESANEVGDDTYYWYLEKQSGRSDMKCGARCVEGINDITSSSEYLLAGEGFEQVSMKNIHESICFLTHGRAWYQGGEKCWIEQQNDNWVLSKESSRSDMRCGGTCVDWHDASADNAHIEHEFTGDGEDEYVFDNALASDQFCFISLGRSWFQGGEICQIKRGEVTGLVGEYWSLYKKSGQSSMECGVRCVPLNVTY